MSRTTAIGVVGPSFWSYMASVMAERLVQVVQAKHVESGIVPKGVHSDAKEFFRLVLQAAQDTFTENPPASINAYLIAADAVKGASQTIRGDHDEVRKCLEHYSEFVKQLETPHKLEEDEQKTAQELRNCFLRLQQEGENEAYERGVSSESLPIGLRFFE